MKETGAGNSDRMGTKPGEVPRKRFLCKSVFPFFALTSTARATGCRRSILTSVELRLELGRALGLRNLNDDLLIASREDNLRQEGTTAAVRHSAIRTDPMAKPG